MNTWRTRVVLISRKLKKENYCFSMITLACDYIGFHIMKEE